MKIQIWSFSASIVLFSSVFLPVDPRHQRWYLLGCHCWNWPTGQDRRVNIRETILDMYRGLFMNPKDLKKMPVVKPAEGLRGDAPTTYVDGIRHRDRPGSVKVKSCCDTDYAYEVFNQTVTSNVNQTVVHFDEAYQFVPTGRCGPKNRCGVGQCVQQYRHHWMLIWDDTLPHYPPVTFIPVEVPSHCECVNVGKRPQQ